MIEELVQALRRIRSLKREERWREAAGEVDAVLRELLGDETRDLADLSETELLARVLRGDSTLAMRHKTFALVTLLKESGDVAAGDQQAERSRQLYLKALHLLLDVLARGEVFEFPEFVPRVDELVGILREAPLPARTQLLLMQHYERSGEFAKAEDALFAVLDDEPNNPALLDFGISFYRRLQTQTDAALSDGNFSRTEVEQGIAELKSRLSS
jgi:flagellar biosynthesis regulator FlbT